MCQALFKTFHVYGLWRSSWPGFSMLPGGGYNSHRAVFEWCHSELGDLAILTLKTSCDQGICIGFACPAPVPPLFENTMLFFGRTVLYLFPLAAVTSETTVNSVA